MPRYIVLKSFCKIFFITQNLSLNLCPDGALFHALPDKLTIPPLPRSYFGIIKAEIPGCEFNLMCRAFFMKKCGGDYGALTQFV